MWETRINRIALMEFTLIDSTKILIYFDKILYYKPTENGCIIKLVSEEEIIVKESYQDIKNFLNTLNKNFV